MLTAIKSIPLTFHSRHFYTGLLLKGKGIGWGFICLLFLLAYVAPMLALTPMLPKARTTITAFFDRLPDVTIKNGKLSMTRGSPYSIEIKWEDETAAIVTFDTTRKSGEIESLQREMNKKNITVLAGKDFIAVRKGGNGQGLEIYDYAQAGKEGAQIRHDKWQAHGKRVANFVPIVFVLGLIPLFLVTLLGVFLKGLAVKLAALFTPLRPDLPAAMRLAGAASIPLATIGVILLLIKALTHGAFYTPGILVSIIIWAAFALFGLHSATNPGKRL